jgi:hypothetical protein
MYFELTTSNRRVTQFGRFVAHRPACRPAKQRHSVLKNEKVIYEKIVEKKSKKYHVFKNSQKIAPST